MMDRNNCQMMEAEELDAEKSIIYWHLFIYWLDNNRMYNFPSSQIFVVDSGKELLVP